MWVLVPNGNMIKIAGGDAMVQIVPLGDVTVLPTAPPASPPAAALPAAPVQVSPTSPVTMQVIKP